MKIPIFFMLIGGLVGSPLANNENFEPDYIVAEGEGVIDLSQPSNSVLDRENTRDFASEEKVNMSKFFKSQLHSMIVRGNVTVAKDVGSFPGKPSADAAKVPVTLTVNGNYEGYPLGFVFAEAKKDLMVSTGRYAAPGDIITVNVGQDILNRTGDKKPIGVQIGCHTDQLYHLEKLKRPPEIFFKFNITSRETDAANPWGGLIYILVPWGAMYGQFEVTIEGGTEAPYFVFGNTTNEEWKASIRKAPAPWGELELPGQIIFSLPSSVLRTFDDPEAFLNEYQNVLHAINYLAGFENNYKYRAERFVLDIQITGGWMHSGYPMMGPIIYAKKMINLERIRAGKVWGEYHEIGHNLQYLSYTIEQTAESGCNVWAQYANWNVYGVWRERGHQEVMDWSISDYLLNGKPFATDYKVDLALQSYLIFLKEYGWDNWPQLMKKYYKMDIVGKYSKNSEAIKLDTFTKLTCEQVEKNVAPYWEWFGYPLTNDTKNVCNSYPGMEKNLMERYEGADYQKIKDHTQCPHGWLPFGQSCFFLSNQNTTWNDAEDKCMSAGNNSHLASCLSTEESFWLKDLISDKGKDAYFVGVHTLDNDGQPRFLDGSLSNNTMLPWLQETPHYYTVKLFQCGAYTNKGLWLERCHSKQKFMCKSGPTSCAAVWKCPTGWLRRHDSCYLVKYGKGTYEQAISDCQSKGAHLLEINSKTEDSWIRKLQRDIRYSKQAYWSDYWLGMDTYSAKWNSGQNIYYSEGWCEGFNAGDGGDGATVIMSADLFFCWKEINWKELRHKKAAWICEKDATIKDDTQCPNGWQPFRGNCFFLSNQITTWNDAEEKCMSAGNNSHLASCLSTEESFWLKDLISDKGKDAYFVGVDTLDNDGKPRFLDRSLSNNVLRLWLQEIPHYHNDKLFQCGAYTNKGLLLERCHSRQKFICKSGPTSCDAVWKCPIGWLRRHDSCYWVKYSKGTYEQAISDCQSKGAYLLEINSKMEDSWIRTLQEDIALNIQHIQLDYWLGMDTRTAKWNSGQNIYYSEGWCKGFNAGIGGDGAKALMAAFRNYCWKEINGMELMDKRAAWICEKDATIS